MSQIVIERSLIPDTDTPIFDYCRYLIAEGFEPQSKLIVTRNGRQDIFVTTIAEGAELTVKDGKFRKHNTFYLNRAGKAVHSPESAFKSKR